MLKRKFILLGTILTQVVFILKAQEDILYSWLFDSISESILYRNNCSDFDTIKGNYSLVEGVDGGKALKLDGFTSRVQIKPDKQITGSFSIETWISQAVYPWNWVPVLTHTAEGTQGKLGTNGFYFGLGPKGQIGMNIWIEHDSQKEFDLEILAS